VAVVTEEPLLRAAWGWSADAPVRFRRVLAVEVKGAEAFLAHANQPNVTNFGIWLDGEIAALLQFTEHAPGIYESHLSAQRGANLTTLTDACGDVMDYLFGECSAALLFVWVWKRNRPVIQLCQDCGLYWDHRTRWQGLLNRHFLEWLRLSITKERWHESRSRRNWRQ
jgi:hypothetical protein